ncbi:hypothetical protein BDN70DRAFT_882777 [Pholiota conissans]|uniref:Golgi apparatus membrane protein TVP38 n=1 Tax=Pholiota conissans TaxID=109636 RepID=A0A9P6CQQ9_9AGAR|nr:hypothetical protein BDN70DRAFT_882777 [Pholiota conissans]
MQASQPQFGSGPAGYPPNQQLHAPGYLYPTTSAGTSTSTLETKVAQDPRLSRTPSPTPSEQKELDSGAIDWKTISRPGFWFRRDWLWFYVGFIVILVLTALITIYHTQIVHWLQPFTQWLHGFKFGWLVPIGILFVISFPPLFGHEIVAVLCGLVWGLWIGFGIVAAGTFLGEVGNFYAFKYCCRARGVKMEKNKMWYACLARVIRDGGFKIALIARLSAIPGHFTTAIFSTCGMGIIVFSLAAILSLPKQFITVYLGVILDSSSSSNAPKDTKSKIISDSVIGVTFLITVLAVWYLYRQMNKAKPLVIYDRRKARQAKMLKGASPYQRSGSSASTDVFNPNGSDSDIPLTQQHYQQWDANGKASGYTSDPTLIHAPKPRTNDAAFIPLTNPRDVEEGPVYGAHGRNDSTYSVGWEPTHNAYPTAQLNHLQHSQQPPRRNFEPEMGQTPTQATFVNNSSAVDWHPGTVAGPRQSFDNDSDEAYGGYEVVTPLVAGHRGMGHYQESTGTTFATAYTNSPEASHDELPNPHHEPNLPAGAYLPEPPDYSSRQNVGR